MEATALLLSRIQFAATVSFHIIFPSFTIGLAAWLAVLSVVAIAFNMRTAIGEIPPVLEDLGLSSAAQSILATVPVVCFGLAALATPVLRARFGELERAIPIDVAPPR